MIHLRISPVVPPLTGRAGLLIAATLWLLLSGGPAAHADDPGLLQDPAPSILQPATQAVEPVVQTAATAVPPPEEQAVAPSVQHAVEPAVTAAEEAVEPAVKAGGHAVAPGSKVVEGAVRPPVEPAVKPAAEGAAVPAAEGPATEGAAAPAAEGPATEGPVKSLVVPTEPRTAKQSNSKTADPTRRADLAPRATGRAWILADHGVGDDEDQPQDPSVWALTNALMHQIAGDPLPGWINAGLPPGAVSVPTPWTAPLLLGLLGFFCLVVARRRLR
jgi:hypothetical protein